MTSQSTTAEPKAMPSNTTSTIDKPKRYHPLLVTLHWLIVILLFGAVFLVQANGEGGEGGERFRSGQGNFPPQGSQQSNQQVFQGDADEAPPQGFQPSVVPSQGGPQGGFPQQGGGNIFSNTGLHIILGAVILVLLIVRLIVRWTTKHPEWATAGNKFFDWIGVLTHWGLYLLSFGILITGYVLGTQRGELARTFGIGTFSPGNFRRGGFSLGFLHGGMWTLLFLLILVHIGAALYHQFILKDNLFGRMWFGKRYE